MKTFAAAPSTPPGGRGSLFSPASTDRRTPAGGAGTAPAKRATGASGAPATPPRSQPPLRTGPPPQGPALARSATPSAVPARLCPSPAPPSASPPRARRQAPVEQYPPPRAASPARVEPPGAPPLSFDTARWAGCRGNRFAAAGSLTKRVATQASLVTWRAAVAAEQRLERVDWASWPGPQRENPVRSSAGFASTAQAGPALAELVREARTVNALHVVCERIETSLPAGIERAIERNLEQQRGRRMWAAELVATQAGVEETKSDEQQVEGNEWTLLDGHAPVICPISAAGGSP